MLEDSYGQLQGLLRCGPSLHASTEKCIVCHARQNPHKVSGASAAVGLPQEAVEGERGIEAEEGGVSFLE